MRRKILGARGRAHHALANTCHAAGQPGQASQHRQHALDTYTDLGVPEAAQMRAAAVNAAQWRATVAARRCRGTE